TREPAVIRRLLELRRVIAPLDRARPLQTQLAARPLDRAGVTHEPDAVLARAGGPCEKHGDQPPGIFATHGRRVLPLGGRVPPAASAPRRRRPVTALPLVGRPAMSSS